MDEKMKAYFSEIGKKGGLSRSDKKKGAVAENGKKGGRPKKGIAGDFEIDVTKDGKPRKLKLESGGKKHYDLVIVYPDGQQVMARYQPTETTHIPDIKWYAEKNGFEVCNG